MDGFSANEFVCAIISGHIGVDSSLARVAHSRVVGVVGLPEK